MFIYIFKIDRKMSTKDNWDYSSDDEEDVLLRLPHDPPNVEKIVYDEVQFVDQVEISVVNEEDGVEGSQLNDACEADACEVDACEADACEADACEADYGYPQEEYYSEEDDDYADELDNYDKKLGRYVSCR